jgi:hypothetical protein
MSGTRCLQFLEDPIGLLDGRASEALLTHVASCDACRDAKHDLEQTASSLATAGDDFVLDRAEIDRLTALAVDRISETRVKTASSQRADAPVATAPSPSAPRSALFRRRGAWLALAACLGIGVSSVVGLKLADRQRSPAAVAARAWHGKIARIARSGADKSGGLAAVSPGGRAELGEGAEIKPGARLATDARTRARLELDDGTVIVLDRATEIEIGSDPRSLRVVDGALLVDVAHIDGAPPAKIDTPAARVRVLGTKLAVTATKDRSNVEVLRGEVEVSTDGKTERVLAGQEAVAREGSLEIAPANDLAQRAAFGEQLITGHNEDADAPASGVGELRAKKPGAKDEKDRAVRLAQHAVKIRVAGNVARTEIDEVFTNDTNDELEGIYRFPLPPGAQIERLALEVDGKLVEGEFIDKSRASAIWRGAIRNATPNQPKPFEEIVWVPGPWHDPALLEWQRGGRFELRIFPIPKRGSRRIVIAYTETVEPVAGVRRYVYPLPQSTNSDMTIGAFSVDAQLVGHNAKSGVRVRGYELTQSDEGGKAKLSSTMTSFSPSGDLTIEYSLDDAKTDASIWTYKDPTPPPEPAAGTKATPDPVGPDPFVAIALRPKLPKWADVRPRDQVIVVDAGRGMFGERFKRARRLAVQMTQEMDRRDRVTILACDVACRAMPGGFVAPGAPSAHDVDAFLAGVAPDGASDLVGAVRSASRTPGRDKARDLRVVLVSDGVATAGYRSFERVAAEVTRAVDDPRASVVAVPVGADADAKLLGEIARGGGGVVVPYQPGQRLESAALETLNATYGSALRDVEIVLPDGLVEVAPSVHAPIRAGAESIVTARMKADHVHGDVVLRGKVGGDPFEARYPIDVRPSTDAGNAFVPRLYAAARISDQERTAGDKGKAELVELSRRFSVPSKFTSLLVLESEAMFKAFGIARAGHGPSWTGETVATGGVVASVASDKKDGVSDSDEVGDREEKAKSADTATSGFGGLAGLGALGGGRGAGPSAAPATKPSPAATSAPADFAPPPAPAKRPAQAEAPSGRAAQLDPFLDDAPRFRRRPGRLMKRIFVRHGEIVADASPPVAAEAVAKARAAVAATPDERSKHKELAKVLARNGQLEELAESLEKWSKRDPLDFDVIVSRADLVARQGDRDESLRVLGGALAASALDAKDAVLLAQAVAASYERLGRAEACAFRITAAELKTTDADAVARAIVCERADGRSDAADAWMGRLKDAAARTAVTAAIARVEAAKAAPNPTGDIVVDATWDGGAGVDLDVAILDPSGRRASAASRLRGAKVKDASSTARETLALSSGEGGTFVVEIARASGSRAGGDPPVSGSVTIRAFGQSRVVPFTLTLQRTQLARVVARWEAQLVPFEGDTIGFVPPPPPGLRPFDRLAGSRALAAVSVRQCAVGGPSGTGHAVVTFAPTGRVSSVILDDGIFAGTPAGRCVQAAFFNAAVSPFAGGPVRVGKSFSVGF